MHGNIINKMTHLSLPDTVRGFSAPACDYHTNIAIHVLVALVVYPFGNGLVYGAHFASSKNPSWSKFQAIFFRGCVIVPAGLE